MRHHELDIEAAIAAHTSWYKRFEQAILGVDAEKLEMLNVGDDASCVLGCWLYMEARLRYAGLSEYETVMKTHKLFHQHAQEIVDLLHAGSVDQAEHVLHIRLAGCFAQLREQLSVLREVLK